MKILSRIVLTIAGLLLIFASATKVHQMLTVPIVSKGFWESWEFFLITIPLELGLGIWLVSGLFRKAAWLCGVASFGFFAGVTLYKALTGELSCGCFGRIHVDPWLTLLTIDIPIFLLLLIFYPRGEKLIPPPWPHPLHVLLVAVPASLLLGAVVPVMYYNKPPDKGVDSKGREYVVIKPDKWQTTDKPKSKEETTAADPNIEPSLPAPVNDIQAPAAVNEPNSAQPAIEPNIPSEQAPAEVNEADLPDWKLMLEHSTIADKLRTGVRIVLFYHYDCPDCAVAIPLYNKYSEQLAADEQIQFAFIEGPPYGGEQDDPVPDDTIALVGRLDKSRDWIFESPLILLLNEGELIQWWQVEYPEFDELLQHILTIE